MNDNNLQNSDASGPGALPATADFRGDKSFTYRDHEFVLSVAITPTALYLPRVVCTRGAGVDEAIELPVDADPYASAPEAWRHAEQQAVRWVHDRTGDGRGQF